MEFFPLVLYVISSTDLNLCSSEKVIVLSDKFNEFTFSELKSKLWVKLIKFTSNLYPPPLPPLILISGLLK